jgi:hypothetical protein
MHTIKYYSMTLLAGFALLVAGCGGSDDPDPVEPRGKRFVQVCNVEARASETTVSLTGLTAQVTRHTGANVWLTVDILPYVSGTPQVKVTTAENDETAVRQQELVFYAARDTLVLTVRQAVFASEGGADMNQPFDTPSDEQAYSREMR